MKLDFLTLFEWRIKRRLEASLGRTLQNSVWSGTLFKLVLVTFFFLVVDYGCIFWAENPKMDL